MEILNLKTKLSRDIAQHILKKVLKKKVGMDADIVINRLSLEAGKDNAGADRMIIRIDGSMEVEKGTLEKFIFK